MQVRLQEIRDRFNKGKNSKGWQNKAIRNFIVHAPEDVGFLLDALQLTVDSLHNREIELEQSQEKLKQYEIVRCGLKYWIYHCGHSVQGENLGQCPVCALHQAREREQVLRDALTNIYNATAKDAGLTMHEVTKIYCCARDALGHGDPNGN